MLIIYVCHDEVSTNLCLSKQPESRILFVGPNDYPKNERVIVVRDLLYNIESERKLLTFTAWYAIIANKLFVDEEYLCILEWDTDIPDLKLFTPVTDAICFFSDSGKHFLNDIKIDVFDGYLKEKGIVYKTYNKEWSCTTNYILKRKILEEFVEFYYPSCNYITKFHPEKISWYHERIFWVFLFSKNSSINILDGGIHRQANSHKDLNII
jgi:hypothetical protein